MRLRLTLFFLFFSMLLDAQQIQTHLINIPGASIEYYDIANAEDSGFYAVGNAASASRTDGIITRFDINGNVLWSKCYTEGTGVLFFSYVTPFPGGVYVSGFHNWNTSLAYGELVKFDAQGNILWKKQFGTSSNYYMCFSGVCNSSGDLFFTTFNGQGADTSFVVKCDASGNILWSLRTSLEWIDDVFINTGDTLVVCGYGQNGPSVIFMDQNGNILSQLEYIASMNNVWLYDQVPTLDEFGNIYSTGYLDSNGTERLFVYKSNSAGNVIWSRQITNLTSNVDFWGISCQNNLLVLVGDDQPTGNVSDQLIIVLNADSGNVLNATWNLVGTYGRWTSVCATGSGWSIAGTRDSAGVVSFTNFLGATYCNEAPLAIAAANLALTAGPSTFISYPKTEIVNPGTVALISCSLTYSFECPVSIIDQPPASGTTVLFHLNQSVVDISVPSNAIQVELYDALGRTIATQANVTGSISLQVSSATSVIFYRVVYAERVEGGIARIEIE